MLSSWFLALVLVLLTLGIKFGSQLWVQGHGASTAVTMEALLRDAVEGTQN